MLKIAMIIMLFLFNGDKNDVVICGETYKINMMKGWESGTTEKMMGKPARRKIAGYDASIISRFHPDRKADCSIEITEYIKCRDYLAIQKRDSMIHASSGLCESIKWYKRKELGCECYVDLISSPQEHIETGEITVLRERAWYRAGRNNVYVIKFQTTSVDSWRTYLPEMEKIVASLKEE